MPPKPILLFCLMLLTACAQSIELQMKPSKPVLVVNGLLTPDRIISVQIGTTSSITGKRNDSLVSNARVALSVNGVFKEWMTAKGNGVYTSEAVGFPIPGNTYAIRTIVAGYEPVSAETVLPDKVLHTSTFKIEGADNTGFPYTNVCFKIDDLVGQNYYEFIISQLYFIGGPTNPNQNPTLNTITGWKSTDPVITEEGDQDYEPETFVFSDKLFEAQTYTVKVRRGGNGGNLYGTLRTVSRAYYLYRKYWFRHKFNKNPIDEQTIVDKAASAIFAGEPIEMKSNIQGGYGVWAAYNSHTAEIERR